MDNQIFRVNGVRKDLFISAIKLAFEQDNYSSDSKSRIKGFKFSKEFGLILYWFVDSPDVNAFMTPVLPEDIAEMLWSWLHSEQAKEVILSDGCQNIDDDDFDGSVKLGWEVYKQQWGRIDNETYSLFAIKPAYGWYGK